MLIQPVIIPPRYMYVRPCWRLGIVLTAWTFGAVLATAETAFAFQVDFGRK